MTNSDPFERLRPPERTPDSDRCDCAAGTPLKLISRGGTNFNPIACLDCNLEVSPERIGLPAALAWAVADWLWTYGAIDVLELASGPYEQWARDQLLDLASPPNVEGRAVTDRLNELQRTYFWLFQPETDDDWAPPAACPICNGPLAPHTGGIFPQLLCERDSIVLPGG